MLRKFFDINRRLSDKVEVRLPHRWPSIYDLYEEMVARRMNSGEGKVVVDVGGGKSCPFAKFRKPELNTKIIAVDVSSESLSENRDADETRVANIMRELPFEDDSVDLVVSRSVLEHLQSVEEFVKNSKSILKPGGHFIHLFPSKFAPFALINQLLPNRLGKRVLHLLFPATKGIGGFPAFYDNCHHSAIVSLLEKHGFEVREEHAYYFQSAYFGFFFPLFMLSVLYELLIRAVGAKDLAAFVLISARKSGQGSE